MVRKISIIRRHRGILAACLCVALSACDNAWLEDVPSLDAVLSKSWLLGKTGVESDEPKPITPVYCYETIGAGDCYDEPLEGGGSRLVGFEGPAPAAESRPTTP